jgi:PAS domain S-box-containing protein
MPYNSDENIDWNSLRDKIIGLGESSIQKSYYPELQKRLGELERFRSLLDQSNDSIFLIKIPSGRFSDVNKSASEQFGYSPEKFFTMSVHELVVRDEIVRFRKLFNELVKQSRGRKTFSSIFQSVDGKRIPVEIGANVVQFSDIFYIVMVVRDVTERMEAENRIRSSLEEKEVLLREIHHRVKNNMQIISSLLNLQTRYITDEKVVDILKESQSRVKSMAMIHEKLYQSNELARIDFKDYIDKLIAFLTQSYMKENDPVRIETSVEDIYLNIDTGVPCGLIINELITNSLKHAFPDNRGGLIKIELLKEGDLFILKVCDNGIGFPEKLDFRNTETLGLQLINNLVMQLDGAIELKVNHGTEFKISFHSLKYRQRI